MANRFHIGGTGERNVDGSPWVEPKTGFSGVKAINDRTHLGKEQRLPPPEGGVALLEERDNVVLREVGDLSLPDVDARFHVVRRKALLLLVKKQTATENEFRSGKNTSTQWAHTS